LPEILQSHFFPPINLFIPFSFINNFRFHQRISFSNCLLIKPFMRIFFATLFILIVFLSANVQNNGAKDKKDIAERGKIIDTVRCNSNSNFSYALYLPSYYSDTVAWPVIYVFDPGARGRLAVSYFCQAAEKLGYIIACSNNSRNYLSAEDLTEALNYMFVDVEEKIPLDPDGFYTSGLSGGSRVAAMVALNNTSISGVIACGAGYPDYSATLQRPSFNYIGLVGNRDMNYGEMINLEKKLDSLGANVELRVFEGGHYWPSPDLIQEALEWMELQSMNKGIKPKNTAFIDAQFEKYTNEAKLLLTKRKLMEAACCYEYMIKDFPNYPDVVEIIVSLDSLEESKAYKKSVLKWNKNRAWELETENKLITTLKNQVLLELLPDSICNWWAGQVNSLRKTETGKDTDRQVIASRILMTVRAACYEGGRNSLNLKIFRGALICHRLAVIADPENNYAYFLLARTYAFNNDIKNSLRSLETAVKLGYTDRQSIESDPAFAAFKNEKRYEEILMKLH
jgi:hypothetical protein